MASKNRLLLIGWDSADWKIIHPMLDRGELPALARLVEGGVSGNLTTLEPQLSPMLWTSIATGKMAYHHGVHGFTEIHPQSGKIVPVSAASRQCRTIWEMLGQHGLRSHVIGWFATQGERGLDGKMVSNMFAHVRGATPDASPNAWPPPMPGTYWPENLHTPLDPLRVSPWEISGDEILRAFVPKAHLVDQKKDRRLHQLAERLAEAYSIQSAATYVMETDPEWDFAAVYFRAIDEICHTFMPYHPPKMDGVRDEDFEIYQHVVTGAYRVHDMMLQRLIHLAGPDTSIMLVSDHGFHSDHLRPASTPRVPAGITVWHRPQGVLIAKGPGFANDQLVHGARLLDITPTILHHFGLPVGEDMEGRVLGEMFTRPAPVTFIPTWETSPLPERSHLSDGDSEALLEQFVALGYIDEVSTDLTEAATETRRENDWNLARACLYGGKYEAALLLLENCHAARPDRSDYSQLLARTQLQLGLLDEAETILQLCIQSLGNNDAARLLMGSIETQRGNHTTALLHLQAVRANSPENAQLLHTLTDTLLALRHWQDAAETARKILILDPGSAQGHLILARCLLHEARPREAVDAALHAIGLQYGNPRGHLLLGIALIRLEDWASARQALENHLQLAPSSPLGARYLAQAHRALHQPGQAERYDLQARVLRSRKNTRQSERLATILSAARERAARRSTSDRADYPTPSAPLEFTIVSGLPRSGTSLMMQILRAGGMDIMHDGIRTADDDNQEGYWEWEQIKALRKNPRIIEQAGGKVIKIISALLNCLPSHHRYRILFMRRPVPEVVDSQWKMLANRGTVPRSERAHLISAQEKHLASLLGNLRKSPHVDLLEIHYPTLVHQPATILPKLAEFMGPAFHGTPESLAAVIKPQLHRNRIPL